MPNILEQQIMEARTLVLEALVIHRDLNWSHEIKDKVSNFQLTLTALQVLYRHVIYQLQAAHFHQNSVL